MQLSGGRSGGRHDYTSPSNRQSVFPNIASSTMPRQERRARHIKSIRLGPTRAQEAAYSRMSALAGNLLFLKLIATSTIANLQPLLDMKRSFQADEEDIQNQAIRIGLKYELATTELHAVVKLAESMMNEPPAYTTSPQAEQYIMYCKALELHHLCLTTYG
ncbi:uncharacterized protein LTR77_010950 [Saxophila tyrrhenica]|uniref:Uncharacterized protein n=1 Tax=Saxophila tyrrhenica TaxID=1690608 RepID=A0AAV9NUD5_9PEZI|nr:hypothetical protein LTR77_010950 [Saxophila tyrrhenica]